MKGALLHVLLATGKSVGFAWRLAENWQHCIVRSIKLVEKCVGHKNFRQDLLSAQWRFYSKLYDLGKFYEHTYVCTYICACVRACILLLACASP